MRIRRGIPKPRLQIRREMQEESKLYSFLLRFLAIERSQLTSGSRKRDSSDALDSIAD
ncbi:hypothetical protein BHM03_00036365, partial [Ensete ventricosum]